MGFKGKIEDLAILDVIQYLHAGGKTGTLVCECPGERAFVYFKEGNIVHAVFPNRVNIGDILLEKKEISLEDLKEALVLQEDPKRGFPIGKILIDMGVLPEDKMKKAVLFQISSAIKNLVKWTSGEFDFKHNEIEAVDDINLNPIDRIFESEVNTQSLLMDAAVSMHEGDDSGKEEGAEDSEDAGHEKGAASLGESDPSTDVQDTPPAGTPVETPVEPSGSPSEPETVKEEIPLEEIARKDVAQTPGKDWGGTAPLVLVFTEDGVFKNLLRSMLGENGVDIVTPVSIEACISRLHGYHEKKQFPIVFIEDGSQTGDRERNRPGLKVLAAKEKSGWDFPCVILLNEMRQDEIWEYYNAGARAVLPKPSREKTEGDLFIRSIQKLAEMILKKTQFLQRGGSGNSP